MCLKSKCTEKLSDISHIELHTLSINILEASTVEMKQFAYP